MSSRVDTVRLRDRRPCWRRVGAPALLLAFCALPAALAAQDTLVLRDGSTRTGRLTACVGDRCALDGKVVMREEIEWIGLSAGGPAPRASGGGEDEVWLADGSSRRGVLVGLSLGVVNLGASALDRASVRWIRLASPDSQEGDLAGDVGAQPLESDVLVRRDGAMMRGELADCSAQTCGLDWTIVPRDELAWVGLGVGEQALPPGPPSDPTQDAVQLQGGPLQTAPLLGIDDATVSTGRGSYPRSNVDWIYLAAEPRNPEGVVAGSEREPVNPPEVIDPPPPPPPPPPIDTPTPNPGTTPQPPGERGGLWVGTIQGIYGFADAWSSYRHTFQEQVRLREYVSPPFEQNGQPVQRAVLLWSEGSTHGETYVSDENPQSDSPTRCSGQGSNALRNEPAGWIYTKLRDADLTPVVGFDQPVGSSVYHLALFHENATSRYEPDCASRSGSWKNLTSFVKLDIGRHPRGVGAFPYDGELRYLEGGRMVGSYQRTNNEWYAAASWSLCRAGDNCPPPVPPPVPGLPPSTDPCPPPNIQRGLLDVEMQHQRVDMNQLTRLMDRYYALSRQADQHFDDYDDAMRDCRLWSLAMTLAGFLVKLPGQNVAGMPSIASGEVSPQAAGALEQFYNFLNFVDKVSSDDASWLLPDLGFQQYLGSTPNGMGGFWDAQTVYDGLKTAIGFLGEHVGEQSPASLIEGLRTCGAPTIDGVMDGAIEYLRLLEQIAPLMDQAQETLNRLEDNDEDIFKRWSDYRQACLEHQACIGGDPAICDQLSAGVGAAPPNN